MGRGGDLEASVRKYLPKDEQIVVAVVSVYAGLFGLFKLKSALSGKPKEVPKAAVAAPTTTDASGSKWGFVPPTIDTFDEWEKNQANWDAWEKFVSGPLLDKWCDTIV